MALKLGCPRLHPMKAWSTLPYSNVSAVDAHNNREFCRRKPFRDIPGPIKLPVWGNLHLYKFGYFNVSKYHKVLETLYHTYGPIVKENLGGRVVVHVFDPQDVKVVYQNEGKMPYIPPLQETTQLYRQQREFSPGLGNINGDEWYRLRSAVQKMMLRPKEVQYYLPFAESVATDFVERIKKKHDGTGMVDNLRNEAAKWSLESAGMVCFETRLGCMSGGFGEDKAQAMIEANRKIFHLSGLLKFSLPIYRYITTPKWKKLVESEDIFYRQATEYIENTIKKIMDLTSSNALRDGQYNFLSYLLSRNELTRKDVFILTLSLFGDGLSTTTPSLLFNLYCLANNPAVQDRALEEIEEVVGKDEPITVDKLNKLQYLKAVVKETFRMYPIGTEVSRIIQKDLILAGYHVPAGTHVDLNQSVHFCSEEYFPNPHEFKPERWIRGDAAVGINPYLLIPFGHGTRTCAGRRFAEQDLYIVLCRILQSFRLSYSELKPLEQVYDTLLFPEEPLRIQFIPRE